MTGVVVPFRRAVSMRRSRPALIAAAVAALLFALVAGALIGRGSAAPATHVVRAGSASLVVPHDWQPVPTKSAGIRGLDPQRTVVMETSEHAPVVATLAPVQTATLLPDAFGGVTPGAVTRPAIARFAGYRAWRYSALASPRPGELSDATVLPTSNGVLTVACVGGDADCASEVQSVTVPGGSVLNPTPDLALALRAPDVLSTLDRARIRGRAALRRATTPADQRLWSGRLADAHTAAATALEPFALSPSTPLIAHLSATADAYSELGRAASSGSSADFDQAAARIRTGESSLERAIGEVSAGPAQTRGAAPAPVKPERDPSPLLLLLVIVVFAALGVGLALRRPRKVNAPLRPALLVAAPKPAPEPEPVPEPAHEPEPEPDPEPAFQWPETRPAVESPSWTVALPAEWIPGRSEPAEPEPEPEPVAAREPEPVAAREPEPVREPRPDRSELLAAIAAAQWTCELTWTANLRSAGFRAKATAAGEREREAARSGKVNHPPLVPPAPEPDLIQPARAVAKALVGAGWTPTTRGDHWYSQRFAWTHDGEPPELGAIEVPQATVRNLRRGRPSRRERTTA